MPLLHFDSPASALLTDDQRRMLLAWRDCFVARHAVDFENGQNRDERLPDDLPFWALPEQLLHAYEAHRESSELGQVFRIANGLHDQVDALLIVADRMQLLQVRSVLEAGCDPFHNELSRAHRGSKPRVYYLQPDDSNDAIQAVLGRLERGGYGDGIAESRWAMVAIAPSLLDQPKQGDQPTQCEQHVKGEQQVQGDEQVQTPGCASSNRCAFERLVFDVLLPRLPALSESPEAQELPAPFTMICHQDDPLLQRMAASGYGEMLRLPHSLPLQCQVLSPLVLLPAAFLGFDCVQLLVGAAELNRNLVDTDCSSNLVLQLLAHALFSDRCEGSPPDDVEQRPTQGFLTDEPALERLCQWANQSCPLNLQAKSGEHSASQQRGVRTRWRVDRQRSDQLLVAGRPWKHWQADRVDGESVAEFAEIHLPVIEPNALGQLLQWVMIAGQIAASEP